MPPNLWGLCKLPVVMLGDRDVAIDIVYCGVCHSDIHQVRNEWGNSIYPMVPGHEIAGFVTAVGSKVKRFKVKDKVGVGCLVDSCRECQDCQGGLGAVLPQACLYLQQS